MPYVWKVEHAFRPWKQLKVHENWSWLRADQAHS
jgi:hypothetical protein